MAKFKIFYSWQSDLDGNKTKFFIRGCIDDAIAFAGESEAIEAVRDEATKGLTGSPDIVTSIFSKIDECDLFVADVTLCFTGDVAKEGVEKHSPNPNVLLELGYAVKKLGWERVICLSNTDFGSDYPFDIDHNRRTSFSLDGKNEKVVQHDLAKIIFSNIQSLQGQIPRAKPGFSSHIIGSYDFSQKKVSPILVPLDFCNSESFRLHNENLLFDAKKLLAEIREISERMDFIKADKNKTINTKSDSNNTVIPKSDQITIQNATRKWLTDFDTEQETPVTWNNKEQDKELIKRCLDIDVGDSFFDLGDLKHGKPILNFNRNTYNGSDDEKNKHEKLIELINILFQYELRNMYLNTFNEMKYIPLAIKNISLTADTNIRVIINVKKGEVVDPSEHLIIKDLEGSQGELCSCNGEIGAIPELFILNEDSVIHYCEKQFDSAVINPRSLIPTVTGFVYQPMTEEDYKTELEGFIASTYGKDYYEFTVQRLRPNECCWLGQGLLLKPVDEKILLSYSIHSDHSTGELTGELELNLNMAES